MARPRRKGKEIPVTLRNNNGYTYAYSRVRGEDDKLHIINWGRVVDGVFKPGKARHDHPELHDRLVWPEGIDISAIRDKAAVEEELAEESAEGWDDSSLLYGHTWLVEAVASKIGLVEDLMDTFDGDRSKVEKALTLGIYPFLCKRGFNHIHVMQETERLPTKVKMYPASVTQFTQSITEEQRQRLFRERTARVDKDDILAVDSTSKSTYGSELAEISWGKNKDGLILRQTNELVVYSLSQGFPVYYMEWDGSMPDVKMVRTMLDDMRDAGFDRKAPLLSDRGFSSQETIDFLVSRGNPFVLCVRSGVDYLADVRRSLADYRKDMKLLPELRLFAAQKKFTYHYETIRGLHREVTLTANMYFSPEWQGRDAIDLEARVLNEEAYAADILKSRLKTKVPAKALKASCPHLSLKFEKDSKGREKLVSFTRNMQKIDEQAADNGFIALLSWRVKGDAAEIFRLYRRRDEQEKYFNAMKSLELDNRNEAWSQGGKEGRRFTTFVGLSIISYMRNTWRGKPRKERVKETFEDTILAMRSCKIIEHEGHKTRIKPFTKIQLSICKLYGVDPPEGAIPPAKGIDSATGKKKRGRGKKR